MRRCLWFLAYADDLVILSSNERGMKKMMRQLERYIRRIKLEVNDI